MNISVCFVGTCIIVNKGNHGLAILHKYQPCAHSAHLIYCLLLSVTSTLCL